MLHHVMLSKGQSQQVLLQGHLDHVLYKLNTTIEFLPPSSTLSPFSSSSIHVFVFENKLSNLWHSRLRHLSSKVLSLVLNYYNGSFSSKNAHDFYTSY